MKTFQIGRLEGAVKTAEEARATAEREAEVAASVAGKETTRYYCICAMWSPVRILSKFVQ